MDLFGSLKPLTKMNLKTIKPPLENLPLFFREEEFPSSFVSDDGLQLLVQGTAFPMQLLLASALCLELQQVPFPVSIFPVIPFPSGTNPLPCHLLKTALPSLPLVPGWQRLRFRQTLPPSQPPPRSQCGPVESVPVFWEPLVGQLLAQGCRVWV